MASLPQLGLIGLGLMGSALAARTRAAGFTVCGHDLDSRRYPDFQSIGGTAMANAGEVLRNSDWVVYSVMTTDQVRSSLEPHIDALRPGQIIIDCSTGEPDQMAALGDWLREHGVDYLDATVAGNSMETRRGEVLALVGGSESTYETCRPFFESFAKSSFLLGPNGFGARMKLVFNLVLGLHRAVLGEALGFANKLGLESDTTLEILKQGTTYSYVMDNKGEKILAQDFTPQARLAQHLKDVNLMLALAERYQAKLPLSGQHRELLDSLVAQGWGDSDNSAIVKAFD